MFSTVRNIAAQTGGHAAVVEDIGKALARVNETTSAEYLLGYYPQDESWDGKYRKIDVKVNRPGVKVFFRHGYYARDIAEPVDRTDRLATARVVDAGGSELPLGEIIFEAKVSITADASGTPMVDIALEINPSSISFRMAQSRHQAKLRIAVFYADQKEEVLGQDVRNMDLNLTEDTYQSIRASAIRYETTIPMKTAQQMLKVVVYDMLGDRIGTKVVKFSR
jgi:hypothetical protein